jgi:tetratricopeptide (TPR) repeat protein
VLREFIKNERIPVRNDILRRGALVHTDIALLLPERAAEYLQSGDAKERFIYDAFEKPRILYREDADALVFSADGEYLSTAVETAHWGTARSLLRGIYPHPSDDEFVRRWYRAVAAYFEDSYSLGNARYHLARALEELPHDPSILFYAGAMHEAYGSERIQSVLGTLPQPTAKQLKTASAADEWRLAERLLGDAVKAGAPIEASLRHARVLGQLGRHDEAVAILRTIQPVLTTSRLRYLGALFLGTEEGALARIAPARAAFERAASLFPTAQSPLVALAELDRRSGDRAAALAVVDRLQRLPLDPDSREDPWTHYFRSFAEDAPEQLAVVRGWVDRKEAK